MHRLNICRTVAFLCLILGVVSAGATARIDATTRNQTTSAEIVLLAENGAAKLPIVISEKAGAETKARANELAEYLEKITGAKFEIKTGADGVGSKDAGASAPGILVGTLDDFPTPSAVEGLKLYDTYDGREAYAIRTEGGCVKLLGATNLGVSHAVSRFLELMGCRWFFQSPAWDVIPKAPKLSFNLNVTDRPEVLSRYFGYPMGQQFEKSDPDAGEALKAWWRKNRVGKSLKTSAGHCAHLIVSSFPKEFETHPEYRALIKDIDGIIFRTGTGPAGDGKTPPKFGSKSFGMWGQLCVSNPEVVKLAIRYAEEWFDKHPDADMVGVGPDDGGNWCTCAECAKLGDPGNQAFYLANQVAKAMQKSHPGKLVGLLAYNWHCDPPDFKMEPNVYVELTTSLLLNTKYGFDRLLEMWPKKCKHFGLYDYWAVYDWIRDRLPSGRTGNTRYVKKELFRYVKQGICSLSAESGNSWGSQGLGFYLASRVLWNSSTDTEALQEDFYAKAFGPAAQAMKIYYDRIDLGNAPLVGAAFYRACLDDLETAEKAAAGHPDILARIEMLKQYHVFVYLDRKLSVAESDKVDVEIQKKDALELMSWNYRIRNTYMTFWTFFAAFTTDRAMAAKFNEPTWDWHKMWASGKADLIPYRDPKAVILSEETAARFREMQAYYGEIPKVNEVAFSKRLVAPKWTEEKPLGPLLVAFHGAYTMALASLDGEPLRFSLLHGIIYPNMPNGTYVLENMDGKEIARGEVPYGKTKMEPIRLELKVPAAGVYYFKYDDHSAGSRFIPDKGLRAAFVPDRARAYCVSGDLWTWFYVPKNTKEIQVYSLGGGGGAFGIRDPDGQWAGSEDAPINEDGKPTISKQDGRYLKSNGAYRVIPVEEGMDGAMWTLHCSPGRFWLLNIPTILSLTSDALFVPEEVAKKDGLK